MKSKNDSQIQSLIMLLELNERNYYIDPSCMNDDCFLYEAKNMVCMDLHS